MKGPRTDGIDWSSSYYGGTAAGESREALPRVQHSMKMLFLLSALTIGGSEKKTIGLANSLARRGRNIRLAYLENQTALLTDIDPRIPATCLARKGKLSMGALRRLRTLIAQQGTSVLLCMNLYPLLYAVALKLWPSNKPLKLIVAINITEFDRLRDRWFMLLYVPIIRLTDAVIYGCEYQKRLWEAKYALKGLRAHVIYNGVNTDYFNPTNAFTGLRDSLGLKDSFVVGTVGRFHSEKNHSSLLEVVARLNEAGMSVDLLLVGSGPEQACLERQAFELDIAERTHFLGVMDDVRPVLAALDAFVLPSKSVETFSNAALEAMAMELPVIMSDIAGASEMITHGENGFLYERYDLSRLADLLQRLREDRILRKRLGECARNTAISRFNITRMIDSYETVFCNI